MRGLSDSSDDGADASPAFYDLYGIRVSELTGEGTPLRSDSEAVDVVAAMSQHQSDIVVIPAERLDPDFFHLSTGIAGQVIQKFLNYRLQVVVMGDISAHLRENSALRDFVLECNWGSHVWFVADSDEFPAGWRDKRGVDRRRPSGHDTGADIT